MKKVLSFLFAAMMLVAVSCSNTEKQEATVCPNGDSTECTCTDTVDTQAVDTPEVDTVEEPVQ